jgi:hypothetical protein
MNTPSRAESQRGLVERRVVVPRRRGTQRGERARHPGASHRRPALSAALRRGDTAADVIALAVETMQHPLVERSRYQRRDRRRRRGGPRRRIGGPTGRSRQGVCAGTFCAEAAAITDDDYTRGREKGRERELEKQGGRALQAKDVGT